MGCGAARRPAPARWVDPEALRLYEQGLRETWGGHRDIARQAFHRSADRDPSFVRAHRALQNLALEEHRRGELLVRYQAMSEESPEDARRLYLWGRVLSDRRAQRQVLERARDLEPTLPWAYLGLGHIALEAGDFEAAKDQFREGLRHHVGHRELLLALAMAFLREGDVQKARELLQPGFLVVEDEDRLLLESELLVLMEAPGEAIRRVARALEAAPRNERLAERLHRLLEAHGNGADARWVLGPLNGLRSLGGPEFQLARWRAAVRIRDLETTVDAAARLPLLLHKDRVDRRRLQLLRGELAEALRAERPRFRMLEAMGVQQIDWDRCIELATRIEQAPDDVAVSELVRRLRAIGWVEESLAVLRHARLLGAGRSLDLRGLQADIERQLDFEARLRSWAESGYARFDRGDAEMDLEAALQQIGQLARASVGVDLVARAPLFSVWPVGALLDPDPASRGDLVGYLERRGRFAVIGERWGGPTELMLLPRLCTGRAGPQDAHLVLSEGPLVPSYLQYRGALLSGAALHRFVYVDLAAIEDDVTQFRNGLDALGGETRRVLADPVQRARDRNEAVSIDEPAEVTLKLRIRAYEECDPDPARRPEEILADALDGVMMHEIAHLEDAQRYLPLGWNLLRELPLFVSRGFQPRRIEAWLELRAQCAALVRARNPHWVLANCTAYLPPREDFLTPHGEGYAELLTELVEWIQDHPADFPGIDPDLRIVQQLDRLDPEEIRRLAERVAERIDLQGVGRPSSLRFDKAGFESSPEEPSS